MSTTTPIFTAGGLASGLDTNTIVDKLVALESAPITKNSALQAALNVQISSIGDLTSKIKGSGIDRDDTRTRPVGQLGDDGPHRDLSGHGHGRDARTTIPFP